MLKFKKLDTRFHSKASEEYVDTVFYYQNGSEYHTSIPIEYRRTGTHIEANEVDEYLTKIYDELNPENWDEWKKEQETFWSTKPKAAITKSFFDVLSQQLEWCCVACDFPPNPNWAKRIQDIKEYGYTLATHTQKPCANCNKNKTQLLLVPIKRGGVTGYEVWSAELRNRIIAKLQSFDAFEGKKGKKEGLLPDHKFPEIRWDEATKRECLEDLSDEEIERDFQLLSNQRNQQKREVCRTCSQTNDRGTIYGISFFYEGNAKWDSAIPKKGKPAEKGCVGCAWYDINTWRSELVKQLNRDD